MSEELLDEVNSINAIYGDETIKSLNEGPGLYSLSLPSPPNVSLRIEFPQDYPDAPPSILGTQHIGHDAAKGEGTSIVDLVRTILAEIYTPGAPCIFDLIEESDQRLQQLGLDQSSKNAEQQALEAHGQQDTSHQEEWNSCSDSFHQQPFEELGSPPPWAESDVVSEKKSVFIARAAVVSSVEEAKSFLAHLLATDKKVAKATHNITAWRIRGDNGVQFQDCDDDGEDAAGGRLLHLLELMGVWNVMVVVSRWYGGVKLGPDRFRLINQAARDAIVKGGFVVEEGGKKKGKK
ncbi:Putative ribosomal protein S5 domain 2-type [Septoria linicola]|uniref:Ribosomal protein S5 domain 2-type n=1 Tax=Septoria linicola TaxID=215465 RepID=A0A9Q9ASK4_9PEZI|nr:putative ribosomal protein S5 domain 2-type [Septoria linicola]USW51373.1 Putative ribosomal protein S5 domain 2-type [Septoria linicola]